MGVHLVRKPPPFASISKEETIDEVVHLHEQFGFGPELKRATSVGGCRLVRGLIQGSARFGQAPADRAPARRANGCPRSTSRTRVIAA